MRGREPFRLREALSTARTLGYQILRVCERLRITEAEFLALNYPEQLRLLAYGQIRDHEQAIWTGS